MYRTLLIPAQVPAEVEPMIRFGASLLEPDGEIRLLHVIPATSLPEVTRRWRASVHLVVPAHEAGAALDVRVEPEVRASVDVPGEILESAESHQADGILLTLRADRRSHSLFVGHTASAILHHARADVLVLNRLALAGPKFSKILIPSLHGSPSAKLLRIAEELSVRHEGVPIVTLSIGPHPRGDEEKEQRTARGIEMHHRHSLVSEALLGRRKQHAELILQAAARERYGLLLVGEDPDPSRLPPMLTRPFLEGLFREAPCPVVAVSG